MNDDGASFPGSAGSAARGDVRIGGHHLDGNFNVLAYNYFPNNGDMVIDTNDSFYTDTSNGSLGLRNVLAHEHGHGLGINHVCPVNQTKLMEPFLTTAFSGPQHDDTLAGQRGYGDDREDDDTAATGTNFGTVGNGTFTSNGGGLDDNSDSDFKRFTVPAGKRLAVTLTPIGFTYNQGPQNSTTGACDLPTPPFNSLVSNDVGVEVLAPNGTTVLATANSQPAGPDGVDPGVRPDRGGAVLHPRVRRHRRHGPALQPVVHGHGRRDPRTSRSPRRTARRRPCPGSPRRTRSWRATTARPSP